MRITKEEKREIWLKREEDCRASGLTIPAYCAPKGITVPSFYPWRKSVGDSEAPPAEETTSSSEQYRKLILHIYFNVLHGFRDSEN